MKKLSVFLKQLRLSQLLTALLATVVLFVGTACNSGDVRGARPDNLPVQAGGSNNPYKNGGDTNTNYKLSPDPKVSNEAAKSKDDTASLPMLSNQLIAVSLSPDVKTPADQSEQGKALPKKTLEDFEQPKPGGQIQREPDLGERIQDRLVVVKETFDKASDFINEGAGEAKERHETVPTPGLD